MFFAKLIMLFNFYLSLFDNKGRYIFQHCKYFAEKFFSTPAPPLLPIVAQWYGDFYAISSDLTGRKMDFSLFADANIYTFLLLCKT